MFFLSLTALDQCPSVQVYIATNNKKKLQPFKGGWVPATSLASTIEVEGGTPPKKMQPHNFC